MVNALEISDKYINDSDFREFLNRESDKTAVDATIQELAEFAFGSVDDAIKAFNKRRKSDETIKKTIH